MFYKIVLLLFLIFEISFGLDISDSNKYQTFQKQIQVLYDQEEKFSINDLPFEQFQKSDNLVFGYQKGAIWTKLEITDIPYGKWIFINPKININTIDVYIFENNHLIDIKKLGNYRLSSNSTIKSKFSNFELELKPNKTYTIISKIQSKSSIDANWMATKEDFFITYNLYDVLFWGIFTGFIFSLIVYNLTFAPKSKHFPRYIS